MNSDKQLIEEMVEHIRETDYPGSSLNCGVQPIGITNEFAYSYYPKENAIMQTNRKTHKNIIISRTAYTLKQAEKIIDNL